MALDYADWIQRAKNFLRQMHHLPGPIEISDGIQPPNDEHLRGGDFQKSNLPAELQSFLRSASRRCVFYYRWRIPDQRIAAIQKILPNLNEVVGGCDFCEEVKFFLSANEGLLKELFQSMPFAMPGFLPNVRSNMGIVLSELRDGSRLILKDGSNPLDRAVYYSSKQNPDSETILSSNFDEFLLSWEQICYLSPTMDNLRPWMNADRLAPDRTKAEYLRELLVRSNNAREVLP